MRGGRVWRVFGAPDGRLGAVTDDGHEGDASGEDLLLADTVRDRLASSDASDDFDEFVEIELGFRMDEFRG